MKEEMHGVETCVIKIQKRYQSFHFVKMNSLVLTWHITIVLRVEKKKTPKHPTDEVIMNFYTWFKC